ncbi:hypothetical protein RIF29_02075 [Crotalaria pallida]|uniref:Uncharacterized protein n=1 Tax=Crotalaria pallida TaxID=3830 RepID=A0AAN9J0A9_CROPI
MLTSALRDLSPPPLHLPWSLLAFGTLPHSSLASGSSFSPCILVSSSRPRLFLSSAPPTAQHSAHNTAPTNLTFFVTTTHRTVAALAQNHRETAAASPHESTPSTFNLHESTFDP